MKKTAKDKREEKEMEKLKWRKKNNDVNRIKVKRMEKQRRKYKKGDKRR